MISVGCGRQFDNGFHSSQVSLSSEIKGRYGYAMLEATNVMELELL